MSSASRIKASDRRPVEEIDAIMVKYSAWASSRAPDVPPADGIREVTYSSALDATNFRRKLRTDLVLPAQKPSSPGDSQRHTPKARQTSTRQPAPKNLASLPAKKSARQSAAPSLASAKVSSEMQPPANRVVSLSVRLAAEECALVRMRAAESRLSVSAYLRQCVLDVDAMRVFVEKISAELHATAAAGTSSQRQRCEPALLPTSTPAAHHPFPGFITRYHAAILRLFSR
jgi:hypothetical protein